MENKKKYDLNLESGGKLQYSGAAVLRRGDGRITTRGVESGVVINMGKHLRILLLTEVIIRVDRTGIYTIERDQMVGYYVYKFIIVCVQGDSPSMLIFSRIYYFVLNVLNLIFGNAYLMIIFPNTQINIYQ